MSAPLPIALRVRFQRLIEEGLSGRAAALRLQLSPATGARWALSVRRTGQARAAPQGRPKGKGKLDPHRVLFAEIIQQDGDITMPELSAALFEATGVRAHHNAIGKFLRKLGYTYKKRRWSPTNAAVPGSGVSARNGSGIAFLRWQNSQTALSSLMKHR